jgi:hypothetical protein
MSRGCWKKIGAGSSGGLIHAPRTKAICLGKQAREGHNADPPPRGVGDFKWPMLKTAVVPNVIGQHFTRDYLCVSSRFSIPGQLVTLRIGDSPATAHNNIEKVSRHDEKHPQQRNVEWPIRL